MNSIEKLRHVIFSAVNNCPSSSVVCCKCSNTGSSGAREIVDTYGSGDPCITQTRLYRVMVVDQHGGSSGPNVPGSMVSASEYCSATGGMPIGTINRPLPPGQSNPMGGKQGFTKKCNDICRNAQRPQLPELMPEDEGPPLDREQREMNNVSS